MAELLIVNNSLWGNGWQDWGGGLGNGNTQIDGMVIRNNAVAGNLSFEIDMEEIDPSPWTIDHNLIDGWDGYPGELCGANCQIGDPLWADPVSGDFHLQAGSPAVDAGSAALAPADDFDGVARPQGAGVDIVAGALGLQGSVKGLLVVGSSEPLAISCRTYNQETATRTFGQNLPALTSSDALAGGEEGIVPHLKRGARFRANLGVVNLRSERATVEIRLFDASGQQVGTDGALALAADTWRQQSDVLGWLGAGDREIAYARVTASPASARVWVYASLVDNSTGDPTYRLLQP